MEPFHSSRIAIAIGLAAALVVAGCHGSSDHSGNATDTVTVAGTVSGDAPLAGAAVAFVPASLVASSNSTQPLEDLATDAEFQTLTDTDGEYSVEIDAGRYYVHVTPASGDVGHLPGGSLSRVSTMFESGSSILDIAVSGQPPSGATHVGSSTCLGCHVGHADIMGTLHFLGLRKVTTAGSEPSSLQDLSSFPDADASLSFYADSNPDDNTGGGDGYGQRVSSGLGYNVLLGVDATGYYQALESDDGTRVSERLYLAFTYGGEGVYKQRAITRLDKDGLYTAVAGAGSYYVLPAQFSETTGVPARGGEVTEPEWQPYYPERWAAPAVDGGAAGATPAFAESFDNDCAGCHFTGMALTRDADGLFLASAVADPGGPIDFDGDGMLDEMNIGCERCHGPGSAHVAAAGGSIVNPELLSSGRANLVCGQCHAHGTGNVMLGGVGGGSPPSRNDGVGAAEFVQAGLAPAEYFGTADGDGVLPDFGTSGGFLDPIDLTTHASSWKDSTDDFGSDHDHSRDQRQHYFDHLRSPHARNSRRLLACWDCHDPHAREARGQVSETADNNVLCLRCHRGTGDWSEITKAMVTAIDGGATAGIEVLSAIDEHTTQRVFDLVGVAMALGPASYTNPAGSSRLGRCTTCHMPKTARSGSWITDDEDFVIRGDLSSHIFDVIAPRVSDAMADAGRDPVPNSCADCHRGSLRGAWPDYRAKP